MFIFVPYTTFYSHYSHVLQVKHAMQFDDRHYYVARNRAVCVVYVGAFEWFVSILWAIRLM
jgi:hypothetical protein